MAEKRCASCGATLLFLMREELQLGKNSFLLGSRPNLTAGALDTGIWACPICGKLDFYLAGSEELREGSGIAKVRCSRCGADYEMDSPKCPRCGEKNENW